MKNKSKVKQNNKIFVTIALTLIFIYVLYTAYLLVKQPTDTFTVEKGTLYLEEIAEGYVIRKEAVVKGENYKNGMEQIAIEGEKVANNQSIFRYYSNNEEELKEKIVELDGKIEEALAKENTNIYSSDLKILEGQIDEKITNLNELTNLNEITESKKQIGDLVTKKAKMAGELSPSGSYIKELIEERSKYENQLNSGSEYVKAPNSGVVSYRVDGLEETLANVDFTYLSESYLQNLNLKTGKMVATSDESGKVIDNFSCYIVTILNSEKAKEAKVGDKLKVSFSEEKEIAAEIKYIKPEDTGNNIIVLETKELTDELINYRKLSFNLIWWSYAGLKVPNQAIIEQNGLQYVVRSRAGYSNKILVKVLRKNDNYSIVTSYTTDELKELGYNPQEISSYKKISLYDEILLNPNLEKVE
ncbi:MAG: hypothetical protein IKF83_03745 [Clostridia bacterium]|nr:hypothetical protein [Clostridia bacterium]